MINKSLGAVLIMSMALLLGACGGATETATTDQATTPQETDVTKATEEPAEQTAGEPEQTDEPQEYVAEVDYSIFTDKSVEEVESFAAEIQEAVKNEDMAKIAASVSYPITIDGTKYKSESQLASAKFSDILISDEKAAVEDDATTGIFCNQDGAMLGDGALWFNEVDGALKITAINK